MQVNKSVPSDVQVGSSMRTPLSHSCVSGSIGVSSVLVCSALCSQTKVFVPTAEQFAGVVMLP